MITSEIRGTANTILKLRKLIKLSDDVIEKAVTDSCLIVEADAKRNCPVDTGRLRASLTHNIKRKTSGEWEGKVGTNVEYAPAVEFMKEKHPKAKPRGVGKIPFLFPAFLKNMETINRKIAEAVKQVSERW